MFCRSRELSDNKNRTASYHLTKARHEPPQLYQCAHSFQNPHVCKANFLNVTRKSVVRGWNSRSVCTLIYSNFVYSGSLDCKIRSERDDKIRGLKPTRQRSSQREILSQ